MPTGFSLGPLTVHYYGIIILVGILFALAITARQAARFGKPLDFLIDALPWILIGAVLGARAWHILTPPQSMVARGITTRYYLAHLLEAIAIWKGGVGIIGALLGGSAALMLYANLKHVSAAVWLDIIAPGLALAQALGRWGNFINQEVYGLPSDLPWAITIDPQHRLAVYRDIATYHPLFLYESLWSLLNMGMLLWLAGRYQQHLRPGGLFLCYLIFYGLGRVGLEFLRLDISSYRGININQAFMALVVIISSILLILRQRGAEADPG